MVAAVFIPGVGSKDVLAMHNYALVAAVFTLPLRIPYREVVATNPIKGYKYWLYGSKYCINIGMYRKKWYSCSKILDSLIAWLA